MKKFFLVLVLLLVIGPGLCKDPGIARDHNLVVEGMILVPAGTFPMGHSDGPGDAQPTHKVSLKDFYIDAKEVSNAEYKEFIDATGHPAPFIDAEVYPWAEQYNWSKRAYPEGKGDYPAVLVSWEDAAAYARWKGKRLPTEAEWEKAAKGGMQVHYPWGQLWDKEKCNSRENEPFAAVPVHHYSEGASPYGLLNMCGNVWEWCADWYDDDYYKTSPATNPTGPSRGATRVIRGGSWDTFGADRLTTFARESQFPSTKSYDIGFRCVLDVPK